MIFFRVTNFFLNYLSKRWLIVCLVTGLVLFTIVLVGELAIAKERGTPMDEKLENILQYGLGPTLAIPFMIYLAFLMMTLLVLVLRFRDSVFAGITGENEFLFKKLIPEIKIKGNEQTGYEQKLTQVKVRDRFNYKAHVIITDKGIYIHGGLMKVNRLFKNLRHSSHAENGLMHFAFPDIASVEHLAGKKKRTYRVVLKNSQWFEIILPKKDESEALDGDAFSEISALFKEKAVTGVQ